MRRWEVVDFQNVEGEGVVMEVRRVDRESDGQIVNDGWQDTVLCGNMKLMVNKGIFSRDSMEECGVNALDNKYSELMKNINFLE